MTGNMEAPCNYEDNTYPFRQDSSFLYYFGLDIPNLAGVIDTDSGDEIIFGDRKTMQDIIWSGAEPDLEEHCKRVGIKQIRPLRSLFLYIAKAKITGRKVHFLPPYRAATKLLLTELLGFDNDYLTSAASLRLIQAIISMRLIKEPCEIEELKKAAATGYDMHIIGMQMATAGTKEHEIAAAMECVAHAVGHRTSFPSIVTQHGEVLHNHPQNVSLEPNRMLLVDAGAETEMHYASDYTRTIPVDGKFSPKAAIIYNIVLAANEEARRLARPGATYLSVHLAVCNLIAYQLTCLGIMKGDPEEAVSRGAHALFMPHGLGHALGLDVHDMENLGQRNVGYDSNIRPSTQFGLASLRFARTLLAGHVVTNEPGIYFIPALIDKWSAEKRFRDFINYPKVAQFKSVGGIRLEDDLLITEQGCEVLGKRLPITRDEVIEAMADKI